MPILRSAHRDACQSKNLQLSIAKSLCLRSPFAMPSLWVRSPDWNWNGFKADLERYYNGPTWEDEGGYLGMRLIFHINLLSILYYLIT